MANLTSKVAWTHLQKLEGRIVAVPSELYISKLDRILSTSAMLSYDPYDHLIYYNKSYELS